MIQALIHNLFTREPFRGGWHTLCLLDTDGHILAARTYTQQQVDDMIMLAIAYGRAEFKIGYGPHTGPSRRLYGIEWRTGGEARRPQGLRRFHRFNPLLPLHEKERVQVAWTVLGNKEGAIND